MICIAEWTLYYYISLGGFLVMLGILLGILAYKYFTSKNP